MIKIGLTGPTGAGKSTVAAALAAAGLPLIDADKEARAVTAAGSPVLEKIAAVFGAQMLLPDGTLNRPALAAAAFSSAENTKKLNALTHPAVLERVQAALDTAAAAGARAAVMDVPLLFESGWDRLCDHTVAVVAREDVRLARICARDRLSEPAARQRIAAQPPIAFYTARAEVILHNDTTREALEEQIAALLTEIGRWCA